MKSTTHYKSGDVVAVRIKFTEDDRTKRRPAVILTDDNYHNSRADAIVVALSSSLDDSYYGDYELYDWKVAGLPKPCKAKGVIQTIERSTIERTYGALSKQDFRNLKVCIRDILCLDA